MNKVVDYVISLTHLYGLVHKDKVVEIYNMQNNQKTGYALPSCQVRASYSITKFYSQKSFAQNI